MAKRSKRRDSWGSITEVERGKRYVIRYWASTDERGYRRHCVTVRGTRADAERKRAELMLDHSKDAPCPTVGTVWRGYALPDMELMVESGDLSRTTLDQYKRWWKKHVDPRWGCVPCDDVRPLAVQQWVSQLGYSQATNAMPILKKVMGYAVRYEFAVTNPMNEKYVMPSRTTVSKRDAGTWRLADLGRVWGRLYGTWMEPAFIIAAFGGVRVGESLGPLAGEVEHRVIDGVDVALVPIRRQVEHHGKVEERLKNRQSSRTVAIAGSAAVRLCDIAMSKNAESFLTDDGFGGHVTQERYTANWRKLGIGHPFRNLRNSYQTWMRWEVGMKPYYIEVVMGHQVDGVTGEHYDRPSPDQIAEAVAKAWRDYIDGGGVDPLA